MSSCEHPFWEDLTGFLSRFDLQFDPSCESQIYNFVLRIMLLGSFVGLVGSVLGGPIVLAVCILLSALVAFVIIVTTPAKKRGKEIQIELTPSFTYSSQTGCGVGEEGFANKKGKKEGFTMRSMPTVSRIVGIEADLPYNDAAPYSGPSLPDSTPPTAKNLFMNVLLEEYKYNPDRPAAAPVTDPIVKQAFDDYFRVQWFSDPTDVFGKNQSQRQFVTQPSTSIPNDRESYQNWLYKIPGKTCKEGGAYCTDQGSAGVQYPWMGE